MLLAQVSFSVEVFVALVSTIVTALSGGVCYLFKLYYMDTKTQLIEHKTALDECKKEHEQTRKQIVDIVKTAEVECDKRIVRHQTVIEHLEKRIDTFQNRFFGLEKKLAVTDSTLQKAIADPDQGNIHA